METEPRPHPLERRVRRTWKLAAMLIILGVLLGGCPIPDTYRCDPKVFNDCVLGSVPH